MNQWIMSDNIITAQFLGEKKIQIVQKGKCKVVIDGRRGFVRTACRTYWDEIRDVIGLFHDSSELISDWNRSQPI